MPAPFPPLRQVQIESLLKIVAQGECCAIFGLSNTGKSPLLRTLPEHQATYARYAGLPGMLIYIDCNRVVELTAPGFYEIVVRSLLEAFEDGTSAPPVLIQHLHEQHNQITAAPSTFRASLA